MTTELSMGRMLSSSLGSYIIFNKHLSVLYRDIKGQDNRDKYINIISVGTTI